MKADPKNGTYKKLAEGTAILLALGIGVVGWQKFGSASEDPTTSGSRTHSMSGGRMEPAKSIGPAIESKKLVINGGGSSMIGQANSFEAYLERLKAGAAFDPGTLHRLFEEETSETPDSKTRLKLLANIARSLTRLNPEWTIGMIEVLPDFHDRLYIGQSATRLLIGLSPETAIEWIEKLPDPALSAPLYRSLGMSWADFDLKRTVSWAEANHDHPMRPEFVHGLASAWLQQNPADLLDWLEKTGQSGEAIAIGNAKVSKFIAAQDPEGAMEMVLALPPTAERTSALLFNLATWTRADFNGAVQWVDDLDDRDLRSLSRLGVANTLMQSDPESAIELIASWPDLETTKPLAYQKLVEYWRKRDPDRLDGLIGPGSDK